MNDLPKFLKNHGCTPFYLNGVEFNLLLYADDLALLSYFDTNLKKSMHAVELYADKWHLVIRTNKTKIVIFKLKNLPKSYLANFEVAICSTFCYL